MSDDKIADIRERHSRDDRWRYSPSPQMHDDRATLLAEVDRLRAEIERMRAEVQRQTRHVEQIYDQIRRRADERDKAQIEVGRLREALRWYADQRNHFPVAHRRPGDPDPAVIFVEEPPIMLDGGERARRALEGEA